MATMLIHESSDLDESTSEDDELETERQFRLKSHCKMTLQGEATLD
eukprot:CAMPEP_0170474922 /NCGR_PEP_ID=MMETSP0123-20130129/16659_1 /TAXON_ID=182087 /ORGANISM="Favella ehrenbergii, Strain Fehren 1" /LENGTH=45 /DNA_ID= /DNA_START= /DNA_END= /DNA_ORIENTATION=